MSSSMLVFSNRNMSQIFSIFSETDPIYVANIGWHKTPPNHSYGPAIRPYYLLHLIANGKGAIERNGVKTQLSAGEAFLIKPDEITTYVSDENEPWEYYWIAFNGNFVKELLSRTTDKLCFPVQKSGIVALQTAISGKIESSTQLLQLLFSVLSSIQNTPKRIQTDALATALQYFESNYFEEIDITAFASQLGFSRAYFTTLFKERTGESPYRCLTNIRLKKAQEYLKDTTLSIEEISSSVGFSCVGRFSELFKKHIGVSPMQYRKNHSQC